MTMELRASTTRALSFETGPCTFRIQLRESARTGETSYFLDDKYSFPMSIVAAEQGHRVFTLLTGCIIATRTVVSQGEESIRIAQKNREPVFIPVRFISGISRINLITF